MPPNDENFKNSEPTPPEEIQHIYNEVRGGSSGRTDDIIEDSATFSKSYASMSIPKSAMQVPRQEPGRRSRSPYFLA